jgi:hypothetical protein
MVVRDRIESSTFRFSGECPGPGESIVDHLNRKNDLIGHLGIHHRGHSSKNVVSTALAVGVWVQAARPSARDAGGTIAANTLSKSAAQRLRFVGFVMAFAVFQKRCDAGQEQVRPADPAKPGRDLPVLQSGIITAIAADDLERVGVFWMIGTGWLTAE